MSFQRRDRAVEFRLVSLLNEEGGTRISPSRTIASPSPTDSPPHLIRLRGCWPERYTRSGRRRSSMRAAISATGAPLRVGLGQGAGSQLPTTVDRAAEYAYAAEAGLAGLSSFRPSWLPLRIRWCQIKRNKVVHRTRLRGVVAGDQPARTGRWC